MLVVNCVTFDVWKFGFLSLTGVDLVTLLNITFGCSFGLEFCELCLSWLLELTVYLGFAL